MWSPLSAAPGLGLLCCDTEGLRRPRGCCPRDTERGSRRGAGGGTASPCTKRPLYPRSPSAFPRADRRRPPLQPTQRSAAAAPPLPGAPPHGAAAAPPAGPRHHLVPQAAPVTPPQPRTPQRDPGGHLTSPPPDSPRAPRCPPPQPRSAAPTAPRLDKGSGAHLAAPSPPAPVPPPVPVTTTARRGFSISAPTRPAAAPH